MRRIRVAYVLRAFPRLSETFILREITALIERGIDVKIYALEQVREDTEHQAARALLPGVTWVPARHARAALLRSEHGGRPAGAGVWLAQRLRRDGVQHLHAHFAGPAAAVAAVASRRSGVPFTFTAHAKDIFAKKVDWAQVRETAACASAVVTVCNFNRRYLRRRLPPGTRIVRIYNGVDLERWRPRPSPVVPPRVLAVGRLVPKKGFDVLIEAVARLKRQNVEYRVDIVGDGVLHDALAQHIGALGLRRWVRLLRARPETDVRRRMRAARVVVLPCITASDGNQDALPTVLIEAGACGVPVVSTTVAGVPEIVAHGRTGLLVRPGDAGALARALRTLLEHPARCERMAKAARTRIASRFDRGDSIGSLIRLFARSSQPAVMGARHAHHLAVP